MMTPDEMISVIQSFRDGKKIETAPSDTNHWMPSVYPSWDFHHFNYRVVPTPVLREWHNDEIPIVGVLYRRKSNVDHWSTVSDSFISSNLRYIIFKFHVGGFNAAELLKSFEHSLDGGKTWLPCGVLEEQK